MRYRLRSGAWFKACVVSGITGSGVVGSVFLGLPKKNFNNTDKSGLGELAGRG